MKKILIDKVEAIKEIGRGGFGVVYLAKDEVNKFYALKKVPLDADSKTNKELSALETYQKFVESNKAENLIKILDIKITDEEISYLMPLADGIENTSPLSENWQAQTLKSYVEQRYAKGEVFTKDDVLEIFLPIFKTVEKLNDAGIVHRDIKPENIIFINNKAYLADIGLIREDAYSLSSAGTPHYVAPSWYIKTGGKVDMWGIVSSLYFFLSGNSPDSLGRPKYMYPEHKDKMTPEDIKAWLHFHKVILRATQESSADRYITFADLIESFKNTDKKEIDFSTPSPQIRTSIFWINGRISRIYFLFCYIFMCIVATFLGALAIEDSILGALSPIINLLVNWFSITLIAKRIHDSGAKAYWAFLIYFITFLMRIYCVWNTSLEEMTELELNIYAFVDFFAMGLSVIIALAFKSNKGTNKYGVPNQKLSFF